MIVLIHETFCSKMIFLLPEPFCFKMIVMFLCDSLIDMFHHQETLDTKLDIRGSNSNIFENQSHHQEDFRHRNFRGCSRGVGDFYCKRHTYNYSDSGEQALILPKLQMRTIILGRREYYVYRLIAASYQLDCTPILLRLIEGL